MLVLFIGRYHLICPEAGGEKERDYSMVAKITNNHDNVTITHGLYQDTLTIQES